MDIFVMCHDSNMGMAFYAYKTEEAMHAAMREIIAEDWDEEDGDLASMDLWDAKEIWGDNHFTDYINTDQVFLED